MSIADSEAAFANALVAYTKKTAKKKKESDTSVDSLENSNFLFDIDVEEV